MAQCSKTRHRTGERGFSLVELMISMAVGMVVIGAVLAAYLGMGAGSRNSRAMAQMTEDVSLAMNVLRSHVAMAGFSTPNGVGADGKFTKNYNGMAIMGCSSTFTDATVAIDALACSKEGSDAIAVVYEADGDNAIVSGGQFLDCLGNSIPADGAGLFLSYSRFYVSNGQLFCRGPGNGGEQALIENIEEMRIWYGFARNGETYPVAYYSRAPNDPKMNDVDAGRVVSARICLVVRSEDQVMDEVTSYIDCEGSSKLPDDRRMYRAFTSTVVLQNRMGTN